MFFGLTTHNFVFNFSKTLCIYRTFEGLSKRSRSRWIKERCWHDGLTRTPFLAMETSMCYPWHTRGVKGWLTARRLQGKLEHIEQQMGGEQSKASRRGMEQWVDWIEGVQQYDRSRCYTVNCRTRTSTAEVKTRNKYLYSSFVLLGIYDAIEYRMSYLVPFVCIHARAYSSWNWDHGTKMANCNDITFSRSTFTLLSIH